MLQGWYIYELTSYWTALAAAPHTGAGERAMAQAAIRAAIDEAAHGRLTANGFEAAQAAVDAALNGKDHA